jgi:PTH2 family peptidyl-tRNA hydrolase
MFQKAMKSWIRRGQAKVTLKCQDEKELLKLMKIADQKNLCFELAFDEDTKAPLVLAIGPAPIDLINSVTGHLKLY